MTDKNKGYIYAISCYTMWGLLPIFWRLLHDLDSLYIFSSRVVYSFLLTIILIFALKKKEQLIIVCKQPKKVLLAALAGILVATNWLTYIMAVTSDNTIDAALGYFINPLAVVLVGTFFFKEKLTGLAKLSIILASVGVVLSTLLFKEFPITPIILAVSFTLYGAVKKINGIDTFISMFIETLVVTPFALYIIYKYSINDVNVYASGDIGLIILVIMTGAVTLIPLLFYSQAVSIIPFSTVGFFQYINPTILILLGVFVYKEEVTSGQLVSFLFIWSALAVYIYSIIKQNKLKN